MIFKILFLVSSSQTFQTFLSTHDKVVEKEIVRYKEKYEKCSTNRVTCFYTNDGTSEAKDITNLFISNQQNCSTLLWQGRKEERTYSHAFKSQDIFVFFGKLNNIIDKASLMINYTFWATETRVHFIFCTQVDTKEFLYSVLQNIWQQKIYNFVFVIVRRKFEVYTFNNFVTKKISNVKPSKRFCSKLFPDKIKNLEGRTIRVAVFEKIPTGYWDQESQSFIGPDIDIMKHFAEITNCSFELYGKLDSYGAVDSLRSNESEISFVTILQVRILIGWFVVFLILRIMYIFV